MIDPLSTARVAKACSLLLCVIWKLNKPHWAEWDSETPGDMFLQYEHVLMSAV